MKHRALRFAFAVVISTNGVFVTAGSGVAYVGSPTLSQEQLDSIGSIVQGDGADFAGMSVDAAGHIAYVYRVSSRSNEPSTRAALEKISEVVTAPQHGGPGIWTLTLKDTSYSLDQLTMTMSEITTHEPWADDAAANLARWYVDPAANAVHVGLTAVSPSLRSEAAWFGDRIYISLDKRPVPASRTADSAPWWGGDSIVGDQGCTSGFPVRLRSNGHYGVLTAGHCSALNTTIYQNSVTMGTVTWRLFGGGNFDAEFVDTPGGVQSEVYTSLYLGHQVDAWSSNAVGLVVCTDGAVTGQNCTAQIEYTNICTTYSTGQYVCGLDLAFSTNGSRLVQGGDSGGPIYYYDTNSGVVANGIIDAMADNGATVYYTPYDLSLKCYVRLDCFNASSCT